MPTPAPPPPAAPDGAASADPLAGRVVLRRVDGPADGVTNMATDAALLVAASTRAATVLRTYAWRPATVSFGRNEPVAELDVARLRAAGYAVVRRPTGGRALLHDAEVTYAVATPLARSTGWRVAYAAVNARLARALAALGVAVRPAPAPARPPARGAAADAATCFARSDEGELLAGRGADAGKLVGSAVWREAGGYLQHGSILLRAGQAPLADLLERTAGRGAGDEATSLQALAPALGPADVVAALHDAFGARDDWQPDAAFDAARARERRRFADRAWLFRRRAAG